VSETNTVQGELIIQGVLYGGAAINCMVIPNASPEDWFMKQFPTRELLEEFAFHHRLIIKDKQHE